MDEYNKAIEIAKGVFWVGSYVKNEILQCHSYLILNDDESILIDPGSVIEFRKIEKKIKSVTDLKNIKYIIANHQDPDVCANISMFENKIKRGDLEIITHSLSSVLIKHYGIKSPFYLIDEKGFFLKTKNLEFRFITTPYCHSPGAFGSYLLNQKIFFSGDLFGALEKKLDLFADESYFFKMRKFHKKYIPSRDILNYSLNKISLLDIELIAPQHGSIIKRNYIKDFIKRLKRVECGVYIEEDYIKSLIDEKEKEKQVSKKLKKILDSLKNIIVLSTNGKELKYLNKAFFRFFRYKNFKEFKKYHKCICELFIEREGDEFLKPYYENNKTWVDVMMENPKKTFYTVMKNKYGINTIFEVSMKKIDKDEYLASFYDVTIYEENVNFIKTLSNINGVYFTVTDLKGQLKFVSKSLIREFNVDYNLFEPYKYNIRDFLDDKDYQKVIQHIKENIESPYEITIRYKRVNIPVMAYGYFMVMNDKPLRISVLIDLREIKKLQKESKEKDILMMQQAKMAQMGEMVSMIAHQWRQPLNAISVASINSLIKCEMDMLEKEECIKNNKFIQNKCQELSEIIDTFIKYTDESKEENKEFYVRDAIKRVEDLIKKELEEKNIKLNIKIIENFEVYGNQNILEQVLINLLINSRDAFINNDINDRKIDIIVEKEKIKVFDNAGGIKEEDRQRIFMPYFTTKLKSGTGLGLYLSKKFMKEHFNGDLCYKPLLNGSEFVLIFNKKCGGGAK